LPDDDKKILGLVASRRKRGNSNLLVKQALKGAARAGAEAELLDLTSLNVETCRGCLSCVFKGSCPQEDDMEYFLDKAISADGVVLAAPTYLLTPAARLKLLLDRFLMFSPRLDEVASKDRAAVTFTVAGSSLWNPLGLELVNQFALGLGFPVIDYREAYAPGPGEVVLQEQLMEDVFSLGGKLLYFLEGREEKRGPDPFQCPVCFGKVFRRVRNGRVECPMCLIKGQVIQGETGEALHFSEEEIHDHFFTPDHRRRHIEEWIKKTREPYLNKLGEIKEKLKAYDLT